MLEKKYRLTKKEDFDDVFKKGAWARGRLVSLRIKKTANGLPRIGFVVGQKITKKAVTRNKIKRQLRVSFSKHIKLIKNRGLDIVVVPAPEITKESFQEISAEVERILRKAHVL